MCDEGHTVQFNELLAMRRNKRNGQPDEGVCDIQHTIHSDKLFVIRQHKINGQPYQGVCDIRMWFTRPLSSVCDLCGNHSLPRRLFVYRANCPPRLHLSLSIWNCCRTFFLPSFALTLPSAIVRSSSPWREQAGNDSVILAPI